MFFSLDKLCRYRQLASNCIIRGKLLYSFRTLSRASLTGTRTNPWPPCFELTNYITAPTAAKLRGLAATQRRTPGITDYGLSLAILRGRVVGGYV